MGSQTERHGCLYRLIGRCKHCMIDENISHHPNNFDCPNFKAIGVFVVEKPSDKNIEKPKE
jgi:hypothetical protein